MQVHQSYIVKASLIPRGQTYVSDLTIEKATPTPSKTIPVGTPGATIGSAFGPGYEPLATATLSPSTGPFIISSLSPTEQSLRQRTVVWKWSVIPTEESYGADFLSVDISVTWQSASGKQGPYLLGEHILSVKVVTPPPTPEPSVSVLPVKIDIGAILNSLLPYLLGTGGIGIVALLFPWMRRWLVKRKTPHPPIHSKKRSERKH
jgi:hypothetical protein